MNIKGKRRSASAFPSRTCKSRLTLTQRRCTKGLCLTKTRRLIRNLGYLHARAEPARTSSSSLSPKRLTSRANWTKILMEAASTHQDRRNRALLLIHTLSWKVLTCGRRSSCMVRSRWELLQPQAPSSWSRMSIDKMFCKVLENSSVCKAGTHRFSTLDRSTTMTLSNFTVRLRLNKSIGTAISVPLRTNKSSSMNQRWLSVFSLL